VDQIAFFQRALDDSDGEPVINPNRLRGMSIHLYADRTEKNAKAIEEVMTSYKSFINSLSGQFANMSRWVTEIGFPAAGDDQLSYASEARQKTRLEATYLKLSRKDQLKAFLVYRLQDDVGDINQWGVLRPSLDARPAYCTLAQAVTNQQASEIVVHTQSGNDVHPCA
jgi:hypothetical protein